MSAANLHERLVIIVPYRDRKEHLLTFVPYMEAFLGTLPHQIVVVEQEDDRPFNKGTLLNVGFTLTRETTQCVCFHDVDMLPLDDARYYTPADHTIHISGCIEQFDYKLPYPEYMGGVFLTPVREFAAINGCSNEYWGWGSEDDEIFARYHLASLRIERKAGRYRSLPHERGAPSLANAQRLMRTLAAVAELPHSEAEQHRIEQLQAEYKEIFEIENWESVDVREDGLSTLRYQNAVVLPLREAFSFDHRISPSHLLIRAFL